MKLPLLALLSVATLVIVGCGDDKDPTISDWGRKCLKVMEMGGTCNPNNSNGTTSTATQTQTVTITQTSTAN